MKPELKESPREWRKFALTATVIFSAFAAWAWRRHRLSLPGFSIILVTAVAILIIAGLRPRWIRPVYRAAMTGSFYIGQVMGRIILAIAFLFLLTPMGCGLRFFGKDLLRRRRDPKAATYWHRTQLSTNLDREF